LSSDLTLGETYSFTIKPKWEGQKTELSYKVWIDFNNDGDFNDEGECILEKLETESAIIIEYFTIPVDVKIGETRMRVSQKRGAYPTPCENFADGEVEDYTVNIIKQENSNIDPIAMNEPGKDYIINLFPNPTDGLLYIQINNKVEQKVKVELFNSIGALIKTEEYTAFHFDNKEISIKDLPIGVYFIKVQINNYIENKIIIKN
jgi:hypothetical protein